MSADVVELTRELVATRTINPPGDEAKAASLVGARLEAAGFTVEPHAFDEGRVSLVARWGVSDRPSLCLTGHLDTVPLGKADWSVDPFSGETDGDRLFGRGTSDMKGGTAAIVVAAERVAALGGSPSAGLELVLCAGEETGCEGALSLALDNPAIFCIPIGFLGCFLGTKLSKERGNERQYDELLVRSETGVGAEIAGHGHAPKPRRREEATPEPVGTR